MPFDWPPRFEQPSGSDPETLALWRQVQWEVSRVDRNLGPQVAQETAEALVDILTEHSIQGSIQGVSPENIRAHLRDIMSVWLRNLREQLRPIEGN